MDAYALLQRPTVRSGAESVAVVYAIELRGWDILLPDGNSRGRSELQNAAKQSEQ